MPQSTAEHFFPRSDADFIAWGDRFNTYVQTHFAALGLNAAQATGLTSAWLRFRIGHAAHVQARAAASAACREKVRTRRLFEALLRPAVRRIQTFSATTDAQRGELGITIADRTRTPVARPASRPRLWVRWGERLQHILRFCDEATPTRRAKPRGVIGAEVWVKVAAPGDVPGDALPSGPPPSGPPSQGPTDFKFLLLSTRSPARVEHAGHRAGHTAHYMIRWLNRRGEPGPWSETASATVGA